MENKFFDESILRQQRPEKQSNPSGNNSYNISFHLKRIDNNLHFFVQHNSERLNATEISNMIKHSNQFNEKEIALLSYVSSRLGIIQSMYRVVTDLDLLFDYLKHTTCDVYIDEKKVKFSQEEITLNFTFYLDEFSNVKLECTDDVEPYITNKEVLILKDSTFYQLSEKINTALYKEIFEGKNTFSVDSFLSLKDVVVSQIEQAHYVKIDPKLENIINMEHVEQIAPVIVEVGRTNHFVTFECKYKIGDEYFDVDLFRYAETMNWMDKVRKIKTAIVDNKRVDFLSDTSLSSEEFRHIFIESRMRPSVSSKNPFSIMLPISSLELVIKHIIPKLKQHYTIEYKEGQKLELVQGDVEFEVDTKLMRRIDLFEFSVKFKIGDEYVDLEFLKALVQKNKKYYQLQDGTTINIENVREINKWIEFLNRYEFKRSKGVYKTGSVAALELDEFLKDFKDKHLSTNQEYRELIQEMQEKNLVNEVETPKEVVTLLRDYQKEGVNWLSFLRKYNFGGILADEMGLGKTLQTLCALRLLKGPHIVICPKTLMYNWEAEAKKFFPDMKVKIIDGGASRRKELLEELKQEEVDLVITSYSMLQKDYTVYTDENLEFNYKVLDEAHYVKNMKTLSAKAVRLVSAKHKLLLTGTPLENNLDELYGTFDLIMPNYLGSKLDFKREFAGKIERNNMIALEILQAKIRPFILRRTKKEVLKELPDKQEQIVYNEMNNKQVGIYTEVLERLKTDTLSLVKEQGIDKMRMQVLSALLKLRQVCNHPQLLGDEFSDEQVESGKYEQFKELLDEVLEGGEKVLVFSQFTSMMNIMEKDLKEKKVNYLRLDGSTQNRQQLVDEFNSNEDVKVFLISLKAGGVGLNLTAASSVFIYDPWWNPMAEKQAIDRAHRIGQKRSVNVYKFITRNSIEEKILNLQEAKGNLFENLVSEDNGFIKRLEWEDLMELFD
ncbi:MAG: SNF2-related protein [Candidatus Nanoarchaeia archaeon]